MSDYLWDKTGEPEEDVEQLENLLGALKYQPRPLEIPATAMPTVRATRPATFFSRPRLAIAASLLLTLLAGTWFFTRQGESQQQQLATVNKAGETRETGGNEERVRAVVVDAMKDQNALTNSGLAGHIQTYQLGAPPPQEDREVEVKAASPDKRQRAPRGLLAKRQKLQPRRGVEDAPAPRELVASNGGMRWEVEQPMTAQQREATEQLMLALRVASAKFNYAQREMQEIGRAGK